jgi:hypothetical protein|tara:strand:- start:6312 stop:6518 length:207 start_codon:yes stop_codon:yes gene_type:complete
MYDPTKRTVITMLEVEDRIQLSVMYPCPHSSCEEDYHTQSTSNFAEAAQVMQAYADSFLDKADIKGSA